jgi:hypothetical protein
LRRNALLTAGSARQRKDVASGINEIPEGSLMSA